MTVVTYSTHGTYTWTCPSGVTQISVGCWGAGGGSNGIYEGGGGEYASETTLAVTPGQNYTVTVGTAGTSASGTTSAGNGGNSTFPGNTITVTAHGGGGGTASAGLAGTGSGNTIHYNGGGASGGGGGGGGSSPADGAPVTVTGILFEDDFTGTSLNTTYWATTWFDGSTMNNVKTSAANVSVANSIVTLTLASSSSGATISTNPEDAASDGFQYGRGVYVLFYANIAGSGMSFYNWPGLWDDGQDWPDDGEVDIVEGYNSHASAMNIRDATTGGSGSNGPNPPSGAGIPTSVGSSWHWYGYHRTTAGDAVGYWDGALVRDLGRAMNDGGADRYLVITQGNGGGATVTGSGGTVQVDKVIVYSAEG